MKEQVTFPIAPVYKKKKIEFHQARAVSIHPEGGAKQPKPYVSVEYAEEAAAAFSEEIERMKKGEKQDFLAGHWLKHILHYAVIYKAKARLIDSRLATPWISQDMGNTCWQTAR